MAPDAGARPAELRRHLAALEAAAELLDERPAEALGSAQRIAHVLARLGRESGRDELTAAALQLSEADETGAGAALAALISQLRDELLSSQTCLGRVLAIEDDPIQSRLLEVGFSKAGWQVVTALTGADAERALEEEPLTLIVLDLVLPDADGRNLLLQLKENPRSAGIPIIVATARSDPHVLAECLALGADGFMEKPYDIDQLLATVSGLPAPEGERAAVGQAEATRPAKRSVRVLLAEDDEVAAKLVIYRLTREGGFEVVHVADGNLALTTVQESEIDLAILDVHLPGIDGFDILRRLRESPEHAELPVIMLTALGSERHVVRGLELGANDYVVKPFSPVELIARVRRLLPDTRSAS